VIPSTANWISVTGDLDPIGGHFLRNKSAWAYMNVAGQKSFIDNQALAGGAGDDVKLASLLKGALSTQGAPSLKLSNPHSWLGYIDRHKEDLGTWLGKKP
jgi:hypothetical protein